MSTWQQYARSRGAVMDEVGTVHFGAPEAERRDAADGQVVADLSHLGLLAVSGADAAQFLQGQQTNDIRDVTETRSQLSGMCSQKGRLLFSYRVLLRDGTYYLMLPRDLVPALQKRLQMYVLRSRVQLENADDRLLCLGLQGMSTLRSAQSLVGDLPEEADQVVRGGDLSLIRLRSKAPRALLVGPPGALPAAWEALERVARPVGREAWALTEILAGEPAILPATADAFVPQMVNLQALAGVSFSKGCYTGQEVVARTQYLGKLKRHMYRARIETGSTPAPGEELYAPEFPGGQSVGKIVNALAHPDGGYAALAVIQVESAEGDTVHLGSLDGPVLHLEPLPYTLDPV